MTFFFSGEKHSLYTIFVTEYRDTHYLNSHDLLLFSKIAFVLFEFLTDFFFFWHNHYGTNGFEIQASFKENKQ